MKFNAPSTRILFPFLLCFLFTVLCLVVAPKEQRLFDLSLYWNATRHFVAGMDPYHPFVLPLPENSGLASAVTPETNYSVLSPPLTFLFFLPVSWLELETARIVYQFSLCLILSGALTLLYLTFADRTLDRTLTQHVFLLFLSFPWGAVLSLVIWGGVAWLSLVGLSVALYLWKKKFLFFAGMALSLTLIKPHLLWLIYLYVLAWSLTRREFRLLGGLAFAVASGALLVGVINYQSFRWYIESISVTDLPSQIVNASVPKIIATFVTGPTLIVPLFFLIAGAFLISLVTRASRSVDPIFVTALLLPFSLLFSPYAWGHDYVLCAPLLMLTFLQARSPQSGRLGLTCLAVYLLLGICFSLNYETIPGYAFVIPQLLLPIIGANQLPLRQYLRF